MKKGFTLIEVLIATAIIVMVGVAAIAIEKNFMGSGTLNKHRLQATGLAEEGISAVKKAFVTNLLKTDGSDPMLLLSDGSKPVAGTEYVIAADGTLQVFDAANPNRNGKINQNGIDFTRKITFPAP